jgi:hypothetical protein
MYVYSSKSKISQNFLIFFVDGGCARDAAFHFFWTQFVCSLDLFQGLAVLSDLSCQIAFRKTIFLLSTVMEYNR